MQRDFIDNVSKAGQQAQNAAKEVTALNARTVESVLDKQLEIADQLVALGTKQAQIISDYKDAPSALKAQTALIQEGNEQAAANARDAVELFNKTRTAYDKLFQKGWKNTTDAVKKAQTDSKPAA